MLYQVEWDDHHDGDLEIGRQLTPTSEPAQFVACRWLPAGALNRALGFVLLRNTAGFGVEGIIRGA